MGAPEGLGFLLVADLHIGHPDCKLTWPEYRDELDRDLRREHAITGPWDVLLVAGGLTYPGSTVDDDLVWDTMDGLLGTLRDLGSTPRVISVGAEGERWTRPTRDSHEDLVAHTELRIGGVELLVVTSPEGPADSVAFGGRTIARLGHRALEVGDGVSQDVRIGCRSLLGAIAEAASPGYGYVSGRIARGAVEARSRAIVDHVAKVFVSDPSPTLGTVASSPHADSDRPQLVSLGAPGLAASTAIPSLVRSARRHALAGPAAPHWTGGTLGVRSLGVGPRPSMFLGHTIHARDGSVWLTRDELEPGVLLHNAHAVSIAPLDALRQVAVAVQNELLVVTEHGDLVRTVALHDDPCVGITATHDGRLLASISAVGQIKLWRTSDWAEVACWTWDGPSALAECIEFAPTSWTLAVCQPDNLELFEIDPAILQAQAAAGPSSVTAKVVLVGRGRVGKTCLAQRLADGEYTEHPSTHGMRFWSLELPPDGDTARELVLWDLGGQSEYRLLHQIFLPDTELALVLVDPATEDYDDVREWAARLDKAGEMTKLLVGTKVDDDAVPVDAAALERLGRECGLAETVLTSAKTAHGCDALVAAMTRNIGWARLSTTSLGRAGEWLHGHLEAIRAAGTIVVSFAELARALPADIDRAALGTAVRQLARRGTIANTRTATGEQFVVLRIEEIERYAGSLIVAAQQETTGVPALDTARILSARMALPRIPPESRLPRAAECIVLDCVVEMLVHQGLALLHHGQLVFPSLFAAHEPGTAPAPSVTFDFGGAIDNAYASLVTDLALSQAYGAPRLSRAAARFTRADLGTCGVRWLRGAGGRDDGLALFFEDADETIQHAFTCFVEAHLRRSGIELVERAFTACSSCGQSFDADVVDRRRAAGHRDVICQICEARTRIVLASDEARRRDATVSDRARAQQATADEERRRHAALGKRLVERGRREVPSPWILVLSDLHVTADSDIDTMAQALLDDLRSEDGPCPDRIGAVVVAGDLTDRATPPEFERAHALLGTIARELGCTPKNTIVVPGNHDVDWAHPGVYELWDGPRPAGIGDHEFIQQGTLAVRRNADAYRESFRNFSTGIYETFYQRPYARDPAAQVDLFDVPEAGVAFVTFNSAWNTARHSPRAATIVDGAVTEATRRLKGVPGERLKIAVWHHPITGNEKIEGDAFVERLRNAGVELCLHGHVHESRADLLGYLHPRKIHVVGTGSFGAPARERAESTPRLYQLLELRDGGASLRVHTRQLAKTGGAWALFYEWPDPLHAGRRNPHYEITLTLAR